jgi:glucokinase
MALTNTILAGDIGGTKTLLGLFACNNHRPEPLVITRYSTQDYKDAKKILRDFICKHAHGMNIDAATLGVAGPVRNASCDLTNIPWEIDSTTISDALNIDLPNVQLINDVEAMAYAIPILRSDEVATLQEGNADPQGNTVLIAPGTGLGASVMTKLNNRLVSIAGELGHTDYAPRTPQEILFLQAIIKQFGRASYEHVLSGRGLSLLHIFTHKAKPCEVINSTDTPRADDITTAAIGNKCSRCASALDMFTSTLGSESGNLALRSLATGGVYIGGGIAPKLLNRLKSNTFLDAFRAKAPMEHILSDIPIHVVLSENLALLGAAVVSSQLISRDRN